MERHTVNNKYVVGEKTRGKFGVVYSGTTKKTNTPVAIKYADNDGGLVKHEATILNYLYRRSVKHVPFVIWYGMDALPNRTNPRCA
jgi:predicted Ser/Thr protein kinase